MGTFLRYTNLVTCRDLLVQHNEDHQVLLQPLDDFWVVLKLLRAQSKFAQAVHHQLTGGIDQCGHLAFDMLYIEVESDGCPEVVLTLTKTS